MNRIDAGHCTRISVSGTFKNLVLYVWLVFSLAACGGGGGGASSGTSSSTPGSGSQPTADTLALLAGSVGGVGVVDGAGTAARFNGPTDIAVDSAGNSYVADSGNDTIRKITPAGIVSTLAGSPGQAGSVDGTGANARFNIPKGVAVDVMGNVFVADTGNDTIRKISPVGQVSTLAGTAGQVGSTDGIGSEARFSAPTGIAVDSQDDVFVVGTINGTIRKIDPADQVTTLAGSPGLGGYADGIGSNARFSAGGGASPSLGGPEAIAIDEQGNLYVADTGNDTIRKVTPSGEVSTVAGSTSGPRGSRDGLASQAQFFAPRGITVDRAGNVFVSDSGAEEFCGAPPGSCPITGNFTIRKIAPTGEVSTLAGTTGSQGSADGAGSNASFAMQTGIAVGPNGGIYVADTGNNTIRKIAVDGTVTTFAGQALQQGSLDGTGSNARFFRPESAVVALDGTVFVTDTYNGNGVIRMITSSGVVTTFIGQAGNNGYVTGSGASAKLRDPTGLAMSPDGNLYVADTGTCVIGKVTPAGVLSTFAGSPNNCAEMDGKGTAAQFEFPQGLAIDSSGNLYTFDNCDVRKITSAGVVTTLAGSPYQCGYQDGKGSNASFGRLGSVAATPNGNIYVADTQNNVIRKVTPDGAVSTLAGLSNGQAGHSDGVGTAASFDSPQGIAVDTDGTLYVADTGNDAIRKIMPDGTVTTYIGKAGVRGIQLGKLPAGLDSPLGVAIGQQGLVIMTPGAVLETQPH